MGLNYEKSKEKEENSDSVWSSYSDLFMVLSLVFLLMYVVASFRRSTSTIQQQIQNQKLVSEIEDLREQNNVYNTLKEDYLKTQASQYEQETYENLMDKLSLLEDDADQEQKQLEQQADELDKKRQALNHYQRIVRNIINTNMLAKASIERKDQVIEKTSMELDQSKKEVAEKTQTIAKISQNLDESQETLKVTEQRLEQKIAESQKLQNEVKNRKAEIEKNNKFISEIKSDLKKKMAKLEAERDKNAISKKKYQAQLESLKSQSENKIKKLQNNNEDVKKQLESTESKLKSATSNLSATQMKVAALNKEREKLSSTLKDKTKQYMNQIEEMKNQNAADLKQQRAEFEKKLAESEMSGKEKEKEKQKFKEKLEKQGEAFDDKLAKLMGKLKDSEAKVGQFEAENAKFEDYIDNLEKEKAALKQDLKDSKSDVLEKRKLAQDIKDKLAGAGIKADVDMNTGDVILNFGDEYFNVDSHQLKPGMVKILNKFIPLYAGSLFSDPNIASKIEFVEIVGFASPTYKGKYVDPKSMSMEDREAVQYNLDLSYRRARSIFDYTFDRQKLKFNYQEKMLPVVKVTGRSFLAEGVQGKNFKSGIDRKSYCKKYNCDKQQRVIVRFDLKP